MENEGMSSDDALENEYRLDGRTRQATRIHADGSAEELRDSSWQPLPALDGSALKRLRDTIASVDFFNLPATIEPPAPVRDGVRMTFAITLGGKSHTVTAQSGTSPMHPALKQLNDAIERAVNEALAREADAGTSD
jgi:hypothetical protein